MTGPNTRTAGLPVPELRGEGEVSYRVATLPLIEGAYTLSVAVTNASDSVMYDYHDRAYPFRVYQGRSREQYGLVTLGGEWTWLPATPIDSPLEQPTPSLVRSDG